MADDIETYNEIVVSARNQHRPRNTNHLIRELGRIYVERFDQAVDLNSISNQEQLIARIRIALRNYSVDGERRVRELSLLSIRQELTAHKQAISTVSSIPYSEVQAAFAPIPVRAFQNMYERRGLEVTRSFRSIRRWRGSWRIVQQELDRMIGQGLSYNNAARSIMTGLAQGSEDLQQAASQYGTRGGLKRWAREAGIEPNPRLSRMARRMGSDARMIARTEIAQSFNAADRAAAMEANVVSGMKWTLSSNHPEEDICDKLARRNNYDMGDGVYPPEKYPALPHPNCQCAPRFIID